MFNKSAPDRIFRVPKEKYEEAMKILEIDPPAAPDFRCIQHEFMPQRPARASAAIVSEDRYYKELMACLESGDLESYVSVASGAASIRKAFMFEKNDLICVGTNWNTDIFSGKLIILLFPERFNSTVLLF